MNKKNKNPFGKVDEKNFKPSTGGNLLKFGLNVGKLKDITLSSNDNGQEYAEIVISSKNGEINQRYYLPTEVSVWEDNKRVVIEEDDNRYDDLYLKAVQEVLVVIQQYAKAVGVTDKKLEKLDNADDFESWMKILVNLLPKNYDEVLIDFFLEYQWSIPEGKDKTFLTLPKNMKGGKFVVPHMEGVFKKVIKDDKLIYINDDGEIHPFERNSNFMTSNKAIQQTSDENDKKFSSEKGDKKKKKKNKGWD